MIATEETATSLGFPLLVVPRSSKNAVAGAHDQALKIKLTAPPVEGKANQAAVRFLAKALGVPRPDIAIVTGQTGRRQQVRISFADDAEGRTSRRRVKTLLAGL